VNYMKFRIYVFGYLNLIISNIVEVFRPGFVIVLDIGLLHLSTDIWKEQFNILHKYFGTPKFVWMFRTTKYEERTLV